MWLAAVLSILKCVEVRQHSRMKAFTLIGSGYQAGRQHHISHEFRHTLEHFEGGLPECFIQYRYCFLQCCGSGMFIPDPVFWFLSVPDLGSQIQKQQKRVLTRNSCFTFFSHKNHQIENYLNFELVKKEFGPLCKELQNFSTKKLSLSSQKFGFGIRDSGSGKNLFRISDRGVRSRIRIRNPSFL